MSHNHLTEDRLIEICVTGAVSRADQSHLVACSECELRRASMTQMLDDVDAEADVAVDLAFAPDRLARQRARIQQRLELEGRPGRLLSFPASQAPPAMVLRSKPRARWAAGAVAAAFLVGMVTGHLAHDLPVSTGTPATPRIVSNERDTAPLRAVSTTWSDDEFLAQVEQAAFRVSPAALHPLDALTPRAWEVAR